MSEKLAPAARMHNCASSQLSLRLLGSFESSGATGSTKPVGRTVSHVETVVATEGGAASSTFVGIVATCLKDLRVPACH